MCSQVRGVATAGRPTSTWMYLVKLMTLRPTRRQIKDMLNHVDSPYIRIVAVFFVRYTQPPQDMLHWLGPLLHDDEPLKKQKLDKHDTTVSAIVAQVLTSHQYEDTYFPRLPPKVMKEIQAHIQETGVMVARTAQRSRASRGGGGGRAAAARDGKRSFSPTSHRPRTDSTSSQGRRPRSRRSEERRVGKECRSRWSPYH